MANSDKNIIITPFVSGITQPQMTFIGQGNDPIYLKVLDGITGTGATAGGSLSIEGSAGQLFSIVNRLGTGSIFSVNDISGIPMIDANANGNISIAGYFGNVGVGLTAPTEKFQVLGNISASGLVTAVSGISASGATFSGNISAPNIVNSFNGSTGTVTGVSSIRGITGTVGITNGTGIGLSVSGQTMTFSNTGVLSINGSTGNFYNIVISGATTAFSILPTIAFGINAQYTNQSIIFTEQYDYVSTTLQPGPAGYSNTVTLPPTTGTIALTNGTVASFNGRTGAVQGVSAAVGSTYLTVSGSTGSVTFTNTGVQTFNGLTGAVTGVTVGGTNVFTALNTFNAGISAAGSTFSGNVNLQDNTLSRVELLDYCERFVDLGNFTSSGTQIPIDLSTGQVFRTKLTVTSTGLNVTNTPDNGNANTVGFNLLFVGDGTARTMTWNIGSTAIGWAGGIAPTYTSTSNKIDVYSFLTRDGGSNWLGFVGGQNF